jgi:hypothetical protein
MQFFKPRWLKTTAIALAASLLVCVDGCGYHWQSTYRQDVHSVAVPIFTSKDSRRGIEFKLTQAIIQQIEARTPYKVESREHADTILEGEVVSTDMETLSSDYYNDIPQEQRMVLTLNFTWKDLHTGQILVERREYQIAATFYPTLGEGEFVGQQEAVEKLAVDVVHELERKW